MAEDKDLARRDEPGGALSATATAAAKRFVTTMDYWAASALVGWAAGGVIDGNRESRAKLMDELSEQAARLAGPDPTPAEVVLAETAAMAWFALRMHEAHYANASPKGEITYKQAQYCLEKIDRAHARLLSALKTLATVRRAAVPNVQINVGHSQVNHQQSAPA